MDMTRVHQTSTRMVLVLGLMVTTTACSASPPTGTGNPGKTKSGSGSDTGLSVSVSAGISIGDARRLAAQYGLSGAKPLPPGIRKNMARGKPIPPGIQKTRLPAAFMDSLPRHDGYQWRQAGIDLVLVVSGSLVITDILPGVFD